MRVAKRSARRIRRRSTQPRFFVGRQNAFRYQKRGRPAVVGNYPQGRVNVIGIWRAETVSYLCQSGRVLNNFLKRSQSKLERLPLANGGYTFSPIPVSMLGAARNERLPSFARSNWVKTRFQISRKRSQSHLPMPQSGACRTYPRPGRYRFPNRDREAAIVWSRNYPFTHPDDALFWQACYFLPDGMRFIIVVEYRHPKLVCRQFQFAGYKFPGPGNGLTLEIIPGRKNSRAFQKCMMPRCAAYVSPDHCAFPETLQAFLAGCGPGVGSFLFAKKKLLNWTMPALVKAGWGHLAEIIGPEVTIWCL